MRGRSASALVAVALLAGLVAFAAPRAAEAKGLLIINTGEDAFETGELPDELEGDFPDGARAGYKCQVFGIFWAYFAKWDCTPVVFEETGDGFNYNDDSDVVKVLEDEYSEDDMKVPFWKQHGRFIVGGGLVGLVGIGVLSRRRKS